MRKIGFSYLLILIIVTNFSHSKGYSIDGTYFNLQNEEIPFMDYEDHFLLVEAMSTSCSVCFEQHAIFEQLYQTYNSSIEMLTLAVRNNDDQNSMLTLMTVIQFRGMRDMTLMRDLLIPLVLPPHQQRSCLTKTELY